MYFHFISNGKHIIIPDTAIATITNHGDKVVCSTVTGVHYPIDKVMGGLSQSGMASKVTIWLKDINNNINLNKSS